MATFLIIVVSYECPGSVLLLLPRFPLDNRVSASPSIEVIETLWHGMGGKVTEGQHSYA